MPASPPGRITTRPMSCSVGQPSSRVTCASGADLFDEAILGFEDDVLNIEGAGARLVHAIGELEIDGFDDLAQARLHFNGDFHHVALEQTFHLLERLIERVAKGPAV